MGRKKTLQKHQVVEAIQRWVIAHGHPPTVEELRKELGLGSTRTVVRYLAWLEREGDIRRWRGARGMQLLRRPKIGVETVAIPLVGEAPAGSLMVAEENREGWVRLPKALVRPASGRFFLLRVRGNSMNQARIEGCRIENGDLAVIHQQSTADSGDIVVALIDGETTIKRFVRGPGYWVLRPESSEETHQPIVVTPGFQVQGRVVQVLKNGSELIVED